MELLIHEYINLNIVFSLTALIALVASFLFERIFNSKSSHIVSLQYVCLFVGLVVFLGVRNLPEAGFNTPSIKYFNEIKKDKITPLYKNPNKTVEKEKIESELPIKSILFNIFSLVLLIKFLILILNLVKTYKMTKSEFLFKKIGSLSIVISEKFQIPYAFSFLSRSYVSIPTEFLMDRTHFNSSIKHELQHIRVKDTLTVHIFELVKVVFYVNPFIHYLIKEINFKQELACDEALLSQKRVKPKDYASCLLKVAESETASNNFLVGATGILFSQSDSQLKRRIKRMKNKYKKVKKSVYFATVFGLTALISMSSYAMHRKQKLTKSYISSIVKKEDFSKDFPVVVNDKVVSQLNALVSTKSGRKVFKTALKNYKKYEKQIDGHIVKYNFPKELTAVAFVESRFTNPPQKKKSRNISAGMWQFIPTTAKYYGLTVDGSSDDRLDIDKETDAAMRYLGSLKLRFQSWELAFLSYNAGESNVQSYISKTGSKDPWVLLEKGLKTDKNYLSKVIAASIAMKYKDRFL